MRRGGPGESQSQGPCGGTESQCREMPFALPQLWPGRLLFSTEWFLKILWLLFPFPQCRPSC